MTEKEIQESVWIAGLIRKYRDSSISGEEMRKLDEWKKSREENRALFEQLLDDETLGNTLLEMEGADTALHIQHVFERAGIGLPAIEPPAKRHLISRRIVQWLAAAALIAAIAGTAWFFAGTVGKYPADKPVAATDTILPGSDKAVLTLSDGSQVVLDSTMQDVIKEQGNVNILNKSGRLVYDASKLLKGDGRPVSVNTITTPRGGQYQVVLPDGTAVWLNAASSISFPTAFTDRERKVTITGEVYFEVARDQSKPFRVSVVPRAGTAGGMQVTVLGTRFNINAYPDEDAMRTTLVEGSVVVRKAGARMKIVPGEQASIAVNGAVFNKSHPDMEEVLAWKNGRFRFNNTGVVSIMRQIARWYDVEIKTEGDLSAIRFSGGIGRKDNIEKLLEILESEGRVRFIRQGKSITVSASR
ncbi:FecR domain-containing protein [Agriterribacter sp.]|uniref:FecR family protein n=1 Tax=Agriterribacter sp. TaxID=2821509 RepID=UPI002C65BD8C|nr:FecR domain-containing protein [Agriterribacter sp.]HRP55756.1 FecR domain-containing protein [Agriterribacter sp.]